MNTQAREQSLGKRVVDDLYLHLSALTALAPAQAAQRQRIEQALQRLPAAGQPGQPHAPNVAKLNLRTARLSLLAYPDFNEAPFPALSASWVFADDPAAPPSLRSYTGSLNPPILHRKELMVAPGHPGRETWTALTASAEALGLFDDTTPIGFALNWQRLVQRKGYQLVGGALMPLGNQTDDDADAPLQAGQDGAAVTVQRHLTALVRSGLSAPVQLLIRHALLEPATGFFDYGCGRGGDIAALQAEGYIAQGWDPHYAADRPVLPAEVVNLGFVVNVIEDPAERVEALQRAFALAGRVLAVGVMLAGNDIGGRPYQDGVITQRNTFQKYFSQAEFKDYLEQVLHQPAFLVGPGVAFVFADKDWEQRFAAGRYRSRGVASRLMLARTAVRREPRPPKERIAKPLRLSKEAMRLAEAKPALDQLWAQALDLGRWPEPEELDDLPAMLLATGSLGTARRMVASQYDPAQLAAAARTRADDLLLYLATQQFAKQASYRQLEPRLQRDIKTFFGDYRAAQAAALRLLVDSADPAKLMTACQQAAEQGLGWLDGQHSLQLHTDLVERLPAILRAYVACGLVLWDAISEVQLVKIHIGSGKLTLMEFEDFDLSPLPRLKRRVKVTLRRQDYDMFEYGSAEFPKPVLYRKSRYLHEDSPGYAEQLAFDEALEATGLLGPSDFGPPAEQLDTLLEHRRLGITGMALVRSERIPDLDQPCGQNFTYRSFIECGETQQRLGIRNLPLNPATYNALYDLATQILDPVIDYFGAIRLTYGFCSAELGRHISKRVAPKLDQHAACEVGGRKAPICDRLGASCDFIVDDENMREVADWIIANLPFDRLYFYGDDRPIHLSYGPQNSRAAYEMRGTATGAVVPRPYSRAH